MPIQSLPPLVVPLEYAAPRLSQRGEFSANLDLLRSLAVLCVFVAHLLYAGEWANFGSLGRFGVILFFVHTSFVLMASLDRMAEKYAGGKLLTAFALRRFFRIYPLSIATVLFVALMSVPPDPSGHYAWIGWGALASNLAVTQSLTYSRLSLAVLWSLPLEVQMYCLLPFMYLAIRRSRFASTVFLVISLIAALAIPKIIGRLSVFAYAPCFTAGVFGFDLARAVKPRLPGWAWPLALFTAIAAFNPLDDISLPDKLPRAWLVSLAAGLAIPWFREMGRGPLRTAAHWIAKYSYGIYLSHSMVFWLALKQMAGFPAGLRIGILVVGCIACPISMYHLIEEPAILFGKKFVHRVLNDHIYPTNGLRSLAAAVGSRA